MISGGDLSGTRYLIHFICICILFVLIIIEWAFQLSYFDKMSPWYSKGGPMSKVSYYVTLFVWLFNLIGILCLIANIVIYFVAYYALAKKGKNISSLVSAMDICAKVCFGFLITSSVFGIIVGVVGIIPDFGAYSEPERTHSSNYNYSYNKYLSNEDEEDVPAFEFIPTTAYNEKICSMPIYEVADKLGTKYREGKLNANDYSKASMWFFSLFNVRKRDFSRICNDALLPMVILGFICMIYGSACKCLHKSSNSKAGVENSSGGQQNPNQRDAQPYQNYPQQQYPNQSYPQQPYPNQGYQQQPYTNQGYPQQPYSNQQQYFGSGQNQNNSQDQNNGQQKVCLGQLQNDPNQNGLQNQNDPKQEPELTP